MIRIVVANDQARKLREGAGTLEVVDEHGNIIGCYWHAFSNSEIAEAKRRSVEETGGKTTAKILERLAEINAQ